MEADTLTGPDNRSRAMGDSDMVRAEGTVPDEGLADLALDKSR